MAAIDINKRLQSLRARRLVPTGNLLRDLFEQEEFDKRGKTDAIRYALGAMQQVNPDYTKKSFEEGDRVINQLGARLQNAGIPVTFEYQGSVPMNIHIKGISDVDLLVLDGQYVTFALVGVKASQYVPMGTPMLQKMLTLRNACEIHLTAAFPAAKVETSNGKSIPLSGGSLQRKIDVVPAHWHDTPLYQMHGERRYREVGILDKSVPDTILNRPFAYMASIDEKDTATGGGTKRVIRLLKTLRSDADKKIELSSYDIASLVWHMPDTALIGSFGAEMSVVASTLRFFRYISSNQTYVMGLNTPDGSRKIIDSYEKFMALLLLTKELGEIANKIVEEHNPLTYAFYSTSMDIPENLSRISV